jgi:hypothetical protein
MFSGTREETMPRQLWQPTDEQRATVKAMTAYGIRQEAICAVLGISHPTLEKHCRNELDTGAAQANATVASSMYKMATVGHPVHVRFAAAAFWLKCRAGWKETSTIEIIKPVSEMSSEEIAARLQIERDAQSRDGLGNVVRLRPAR